MGFLFVFLLINIFDPQRFFGGGNIWDILSISSLMVGCIRYFPVRYSKLYYIPAVNAKGFVLFGLFLVLLIASFVRTHSFLNTQFSVLKNSFTLILVPLFIYFYYQYESQKADFSDEKLFMLLIHVLGIFCFANFIFFIVKPGFGDGFATVPSIIGINTNSIIFPLYPNFHPNIIGSLGGFLVVLSFGFYKHVSGLDPFEKITLLFYICIGFLITVMGDSRGTFFGVLLTIVVLFIFTAFKKYRYLKYSVLLLPFSHILLILSLQIAANSSYASQLSKGSSDLATGNSRKFIYMAANYELSQFKPVHLVGFGEYGIYGAGLTKYYMSKFGYETKEQRLISSVAHNTALQAVFDVGYLGLFIYLFLLFVIFLQARKMYEKGKGHYMVVYYFLIYHIITGISETHFGNYYSFQNFIFVILAFLVINGYNFNLYKQKKVNQEA